MKNVILLLTCMSTMNCSSAQVIPSETSKPVLTKQEYLQKSKGQRTGAIVLVSAGGVMTLAGVVMAVENLGTEIGNDLFPNTPTTSKKNETLSVVLIIAGVGAMLGSISLFRSARKNKKEALSVSFKNELSPQLEKNTVFYKSVPSLTLKISL